MSDVRLVTGCYCPSDCGCKGSARPAPCGCTGLHGTAAEIAVELDAALAETRAAFPGPRDSLPLDPTGRAPLPTSEDTPA